MKPITNSKLKSDWVKKENEELGQRRRRRYLHFDPILASVSASTLNKITDPEFIVRYGFFPLIQRNQKNRLYKKDPQTKVRKIKTKIRPIRYAAHFDALIYSWYAFILEIFYENRIRKGKIDSCVIAYRKLGKSNLDFAKEIFDFIKDKKQFAAIGLDIEGFYDNLDFSILKTNWSSIISSSVLPKDHYKVYRSVTKFAYVDIDDIKIMLNIGRGEYEKLRFFLNIDILDSLRKNKKIQTNQKSGIPQGTPISCVLSNIYMIDFDIAISREVNKFGGMYRRYSDDIMVLCPRDRIDYFIDLCNKEIEKIKLKIEQTKTEIRHFRKNSDKLVCFDENDHPSKLQYLGVTFDGEHALLRHKGYAKFERKMSRSVKREVKRAARMKVAVAKRKIYEKFTSLGEMNYVIYAQKAAKSLESEKINKTIQPASLFRKIKKKIKSVQDKIR